MSEGYTKDKNTPPSSDGMTFMKSLLNEDKSTSQKDKKKRARNSSGQSSRTSMTSNGQGGRDAVAYSSDSSDNTDTDDFYGDGKSTKKKERRKPSPPSLKGSEVSSPPDSSKENIGGMTKNGHDSDSQSVSSAQGKKGKTRKKKRKGSVHSAHTKKEVYADIDYNGGTLGSTKHVTIEDVKVNRKDSSSSNKPPAGRGRARVSSAKHRGKENEEKKRRKHYSSSDSSSSEDSRERKNVFVKTGSSEKSDKVTTTYTLKLGENTPPPSSRSTSCSKSRSTSRSKSRDRHDIFHQLKTTEDRKTLKWLKMKNREYRQEKREERKKEREKKKKEKEELKIKEEKHKQSEKKVEDWMKRKHKEARLLKRQQMEQNKIHKENKCKFDNIVEVTETVKVKSDDPNAKLECNCDTVVTRTKKVKVNMKGHETIKCTCGFVEQMRLKNEEERQAKQIKLKQNSPVITDYSLKRPLSGKVYKVTSRPSSAVRSSTSPSRSEHKPTQHTEEERRASYDAWLNKKKGEDKEKRAIEKKQKEELAALSDPENEKLVSQVARNRIESMRRSKKRVETGIRSVDDEANAHLNPDESQEDTKVNMYQLEIDNEHGINQNAPHRPASAKPAQTKGSRPVNVRPSSAKPSLGVPQPPRSITSPTPSSASTIPPREKRSNSPAKPEVSNGTGYDTVKYQRQSWDEFSEHVWDQVNENERGEDERLEPQGSEAPDSANAQNEVPKDEEETIKDSAEIDTADAVSENDEGDTLSTKAEAPDDENVTRSEEIKDSLDVVNNSADGEETQKSENNLVGQTEDVGTVNEAEQQEICNGDANHGLETVVEETEDDESNTGAPNENDVDNSAPSGQESEQNSVEQTDAPSGDNVNNSAPSQNSEQNNVEQTTADKSDDNEVNGVENKEEDDQDVVFSTEVPESDAKDEKPDTPRKRVSFSENEVIE